MNIGILGYGNAGKRHATNAHVLGHTVFLHDIKRIPGEMQLKTREALLKQVDAIVIATPSECHLDDLTACLAAGKHVLVEKPIGLIRQRKAIQQLVEANDKATEPLTIAVGFNLRFHPLITELRWMLTTHDIREESYYASFTCCQWTESEDAQKHGCLNTWACHEIDLAEHLCGPLRLLDHHIEHTNVNLGLARWEAPPCFIVVHSDMRARQRYRQVMVCTESKTHVIDLEADPVTDEHYRAELKAFIDRVNGADDDTLASGEEGVLALQLVERAITPGLSYDASPGGRDPNRPVLPGSPPQQ